MYPLLETIRLVNGELMNIAYHEDRINRSLRAVYGERRIPPVDEMLILNKLHNSGVFKCRILYSDKSFKISIETYKKRTIRHLKLVEVTDIKYDLKYSDRSVFKNLIYPDVIDTEVIICKNSLLTDTTYTNIALEKDDKWITPASPLLEGTQRAYLLNEGLIQSGNISISDLKKYSKIRLFNSMMPWGDCIELDISQIENHD